MNDKIFIDTNILVYAHDRSSGKKYEISKTIVEKLWVGRNGVLSTQVLQEFFYIVTKKIISPLSISKAKEIVEKLLYWQIVVNDGQIILQAIDLCKKYKYSFWDSLIIQSAISAKANLLLTEDLQSGQIIEGVKILNPFEQSIA